MFDEEIKKAINGLEDEVEVIFDAYDYLYELETTGKKNSPEYEYTKKCIKSCIDLEDEYLNILLTSNYVEEIVEYFSKKYNLPICFQMNPTVDEKKMPAIRIMNKIYTSLYKMLPNDVYEGYPFDNSLFRLNINLDLIRLTLSILYRAQNEKITKEIIKIKYNLTFTITELENELFSKNYSIAKNPYLTREVLLYNEALKEKGRFITNSTIINILHCYIIGIFSYEKTFENDPQKYADFLFNLASIRSCLVMLDIESANLIINKINEFLNGEGDYSLKTYANFNEDNFILLLDDLTEVLENTKNVKDKILVLRKALGKVSKDRSIPINVTLERRY